MIDPHAEHIDAQIEEFRKQLLGMTLRNHLLHCPHGPRVQAQVRVIDELPDMVFERLEVGGEFSFLPLPVPRDQPDDEDSEEFSKRWNVTSRTARPTRRQSNRWRGNLRKQLAVKRSKGKHAI